MFLLRPLLKDLARGCVTYSRVPQAEDPPTQLSLATQNGTFIMLNNLQSEMLIWKKVTIKVHFIAFGNRVVFPPNSEPICLNFLTHHESKRS